MNQKICSDCGGFQVSFEYIPKTIDTNDVQNTIDKEIIGHEDIKSLIMKIIKQGIKQTKFKKMHLLLYGPPATGKTVFVKTIFDAIGSAQCIYYDASMSTQVGLLDHLCNHPDISNVKFICLDELDKMPEQHQFGILNAVESGIMKETKFKRSREVNLKHITFFATANYINKIIEPLVTRFLIVQVPQYTEQQFHDIAFKLLTGKYQVSTDLANKIIKVVVDNIPGKTIRTIVQFASLVDDNTDLNDMLELFKKQTNIKDNSEHKDMNRTEIYFKTKQFMKEQKLRSIEATEFYKKVANDIKKWEIDLRE